MELHKSVLAHTSISDPKGNEVGRIYHNATDAGLFMRYIESQNSVNAILASLTDVGITPQGKGVDADSQAVLDELERQIYELIDYICGVKTAEAAFKQLQPFTVLRGGTFYFCRVIEAICTLAAKAIENNIRDLAEKNNDWR